MFFVLLDLVQRKLFPFILLAVLGGILFGRVTGGFAFSPVLCALAAFVMIYPSLVPLPFDRLRSGFFAYREIGRSLFVNLVVSPFVAWSLGAVFLADEPALRIGLLLLALLPGGGMATTWALRSRADLPATIGIILSNLFASVVVTAFVLPLSMERLMPAASAPVSETGVCLFEETTGGALSCGMGTDGPSALSLAVPMIVIVLVPLSAAFLTEAVLVRRYGKARSDAIRERFGQASNAGLILVLFLLMSLESNRVLFEHPGLLLRSAIPVVALYAILLSGALLSAGKDCRTPRGKALVWGSFLRYVTLALGLSVSLVFQDPAYALAIIPVVLAYFVQIPLSFRLERYLGTADRG